MDHQLYEKKGIEYLNSRHIELKDYVKKRFESIDKMDEYEFKFLALFSLLERFAQEWANYPTTRPEDVFCDFILEHNSSYNWLEDINPVTLYYDFKWDGCEKIDLSVLEDGYIYTSVSIKKILDIDHTKYDDKKKINKHRYVNQIYKMRNKLSHEGYFSVWTKISSRQNENLPCFISIGCEENIRWHFAIPYLFLEKLAMECIIAFLEERKRYEKDPFDNNSIERKHNLAWVSEPRKYKK